MKRHDALAPLSRDHNRALNLAEGLKKDGRGHLRAMLPSRSADRAAHAKEAFARELEPHFAAEEQQLIPAVAGRNPELDGVCHRVLEQHGEMRALVKRLDAGQADAEIEEVLDALGRALQAHVRLEERELFPLCEQALSDAELKAFGFTETKAGGVCEPRAGEDGEPDSGAQGDGGTTHPEDESGTSSGPAGGT